MLVVNLFGAPGSGKSTGSAYIFSKLKMKGINAELVTEFAKDKVWENNEEVFKNQAYIFGKQSFRLSRCKDKVDVVITDSPLLNSALYNNDPILGYAFNEVVANVFHSYNNLNVVVERDKPYNPIGRNQTEEESDTIAKDMYDFLEQWNVKGVFTISGSEEWYDLVVTRILKILEASNG